MIEGTRSITRWLDHPITRLILITPLILQGAPWLEAQTNALELEEASEAARRSAASAIRGPRGPILEALDVDGALEGRIGAAAWRGLSASERDLLRAAVRERFLGMLAPAPPVSGEVAWSAALPSASGGVDVLLGLGLEGKTVKTRWLMRRSGPQWRVRDVVLSDPGVSLMSAALATFGSQPVLARSREAAVRGQILPLAWALVVILLVVALARPRLPAARRKFLYLAALIPALVFLAAVAAAVFRIGRHPYVLATLPSGQPWRRSLEIARKAESEGRAGQAAPLWEEALRAGAPPGPVAYERGLAARQRGDLEAARTLFDRALAAPAPAPGAARELAALSTEQGRLQEAERQIAAYLAAAGPDPQSLALEAVIETDLGKTARAVAAIEESRRLAGSGRRGAELEAQIRARAGDAAGAVAALSPLAREGGIDRSRLRTDPAYLPIATDPVWVNFLNER